MNRTHKPNRRRFLKTLTLGAGLTGSLSSFNFATKTSRDHPQDEDDLQLQMAGYDYPRVKAFFDKKVRIKGCTYSITKAGIGDLNTNAFSGPQSYNVSEIGIVPFILAYANNNFRDYTLLPIFPLRTFRHKSIFIHADSGIKKPQDLIGKKVSTPGYSSSSLTWIRGMLQDEYGVSPNDIQWVIANKDSSADVSGKVSQQEQVVPEGISITKGTPGKDESELLLTREVDAIFHAVEPQAFVQGNPKVIRLFEDSRKAEQEYYKKTGIFPIMHVIAVKTELLENYSWLAESIFKAYSEAKTANYNFLNKLGWAYEDLPWFGQEYEETKKIMGNNYWSYGMQPNKKTLDTICWYCYEQGLIKQKVSVEDLFYPVTFSFSEEG